MAFGRLCLLTVLTFTVFGATTTEKQDHKKVIVVCREGKCKNARDISSINLNSDNVYTRNQQGQMQRANTLKIVSRNFTKNCKYQAGKYHCDTTAIKGSTSCKKTKKGVVCVQGSEDHNTVQVKCWKVSGEHVTCSQDRVCAYSQKLNRALCFNKDQVQGDTCVGQGDGRVCYQIDDLSQIKHSVVCQTKDVATCKLIIREFCLRNGKCYSNRSGKAELNKHRDKLCARLVLTQAIAARVLIHCTKHHDDARCRVKSQANLLGRQAEQAIEAKCSVPKNLHQCKVTAMGVSKCRVEVDTCNSLKDPAEKRKCFREIYGECITKLHFTKHFCQGKSMNPVISQSCLAVERGEIKCYVMFQHCKRAQTKEEKASCEKEVELKCAYLSMQYVECFYHKHGGKVEGGQSQKPAVAGDDGMCGVLRSARSYCHQSLMSCNELEGDTRSLCFEDIRMPCTTVIKLYQQGKYNCARSKPEKTETLSRSERKSGNDAVCKTLLIGTVSCLDQIEKCRRVKDKKGQEYCSKRSESCKGIINRYKQNQKKCFS